MIPTCELPASACKEMYNGICTKCGAPISWHVGGALDVYAGRDPDTFRQYVQDGFFK